MRRFLFFILIPAVGLICLQCSKSTEPEGPGPPVYRTPAELTTAEKSLVESSNQFSFKLFREITDRADPDSNIFISPLSVSYALGMAYNGAAGETRDQMADAMEINGLTIEELNQSYRGLTDILTHLDPNVIFNIANSIWYRKYPPKEIVPSFIETSRTYFDALVREIDFQAPWAADTINNWVYQNTNGKIDDIIKPPIPIDLAMIIMNAIYFNGAWSHLFDSAETRDATFTLRDGSTTACRMMTREDTVKYFSNELFQAIDLPYGDGSFSMTVLLPKPPVTVDDLIGEMTDENWTAWLAGFSDVEMQIGLPKFKFEYETGLDSMLVAMGMEKAFIPYAAEFYNMFADSVGWIDTVKHKTFIQVDENGTEAAAVTIIVFFDSMPPNMIVDRPFLFVIHEHESKTILFMSKVVNPVWAE